MALNDMFRRRANQAVQAVQTASQQPNPMPRDVQDVISGQQQQYQEFQNRLPGMQQEISEGLMKRSIRDIAAGQRAATDRMSGRGLGYGGMAQAQREQVQAQGQQALANNMAQANQGLLGLGNQIQSGAIQTGLGAQSNLQDYQNSIYQQALARQAAQNQETGALLGGLGTIGLMAMNPAAGAVAAGTQAARR